MASSLSFGACSMMYLLSRACCIPLDAGQQLVDEPLLGVVQGLGACTSTALER